AATATGSSAAWTSEPALAAAAREARPPPAPDRSAAPERTRGRRRVQAALRAAGGPLRLRRVHAAHRLDVPHRGALRADGLQARRAERLVRRERAGARRPAPAGRVLVRKRHPAARVRERADGRADARLRDP